MSRKPKNIPLQEKEQTSSPEASIQLLTEKERQKEFLNLPNSPVTDTLMNVMSHGEDLSSLKTRGKEVNHNQTIEVLHKGKKRQVVVTSDVSTVTVELSDIDKLLGSNKAAKKMFVYTLIKMNEQAFSDGTMRRNYVQFPLQELIDIGYYKTPQSARRGFKDSTGVLTDFKVKGTLQKGKKKSLEQYRLEVLFTGADITKGVCTIFLNERVNWGFVATFYTILPKYYFALPNKASDLLYYIFYLARQRIKDIEKRGYFTISMKAVQSRLNLPSEVDNKDPQRTIKEPIEAAIEAIEAETSGNSEFKITPYYDDKSNIATFLSNGYLKVELSGDYAKTFIALSKETERQIKASEKRREAIVDRAIAANMAKKLENEETSGEGET